MDARQHAGLRKRRALIHINRYAALQAGRRGDQQLRYQCQAETDRDHDCDFRQGLSRCRVAAGLLLLRIVGQPGMRADPDFLHGLSPAESSGMALISAGRI